MADVRGWGHAAAMGWQAPPQAQQAGTMGLRHLSLLPLLLLPCGLSALAEERSEALPPCTAAELEAQPTPQAAADPRPADPGTDQPPAHPMAPPPPTCSPAAALNDLRPQGPSDPEGSKPAQGPASPAGSSTRDRPAPATPLAVPLEPDLDFVPQLAPDPQRGVELKGLLRWRLPDKP